MSLSWVRLVSSIRWCSSVDWSSSSARSLGHTRSAAEDQSLSTGNGGCRGLVAVRLGWSETRRGGVSWCRGVGWCRSSIGSLFPDDVLDGCFNGSCNRDFVTNCFDDLSRSSDHLAGHDGSNGQNNQELHDDWLLCWWCWLVELNRTVVSLLDGECNWYRFWETTPVYIGQIRTSAKCVLEAIN